MSRPIRILTVAWGGHLLLIEKVCLRSLFQPNNLPKLLEQGRKVEHFFVIPEGISPSWCHKYVAKYDGLYNYRYTWFPNKTIDRAYLECFKLCLSDNSLFMPALPDWFFADGSISRMIDYVADRNMAVAGPYARIKDDEFLGFLDKDAWVKRANLIPSVLVDLAMTYLHPISANADVTKSENNARWGGIFTQPIVPGLWSYSCRVPNVFLASVTQDDWYDFQGSPHGYSYWDWHWPTKLMDDGRFKFLGSSDMFFMVDLTAKNQSAPKIEGNDYLMDDFCNDGRQDHKVKKHCTVSKYFVATLRGTSCL